MNFMSLNVTKKTGKSSLRRNLIRFLALAFPAFCIAICFCSCVIQRQYRTDYQPSPFDRKNLTNNNPHAVVEVTPQYTLGYVEFDDQGWLFNGKQIDAITDEFSQESKTNGLLMVVFVHGWKHNASSTDDNVTMFQKVLNQMSVMEKLVSKRESRPVRRVVGVYVGWRGLSGNLPYLNNVTFWTRKNVAEQVGHGAVVQLLSQLEGIRNLSNLQNKESITAHQLSSSKLIIVGHSFGGDIVFSATAPVLIERMVENYEGTNAISPRGLGDLVVLINPAFEAARFETIERLASTKQFPRGTNCTLAIFTSEADDATGVAFPAGRFFSTLLQTHENHAQREANLTAVGHYDPYINYRLKVKSAVTTSSKSVNSTNVEELTDSSASVQTVLDLKKKIRDNSKKSRLTTNDVSYTFTHAELLPTTNCVPNSPVFNIAVDPKMIPDHGTIDKPIFIRFLGDFLAAFPDDDD